MYDNRELDLAIKQYKQMGFETHDIVMAFLGTSRKSMLLDNLVALAYKIDYILFPNLIQNHRNSKPSKVQGNGNTSKVFKCWSLEDDLILLNRTC